ncbi:hypothetical protein IAT38_004354 [Cryptococcus sp. DSM 104549]
MSDVTDKQGNPIEIGDTVTMKYRAGKLEGEVTDIAATEEEAKEKGVKNPPKVFFDQKGKEVHHNADTVTDLDKQ